MYVHISPTHHSIVDVNVTFTATIQKQQQKQQSDNLLSLFMKINALLQSAKAQNVHLVFKRNPNFITVSFQSRLFDLQENKDKLAQTNTITCDKEI